MELRVRAWRSSTTAPIWTPGVPGSLYVQAGPAPSVATTASQSSGVPKSVTAAQSSASALDLSLQVGAGVACSVTLRCAASTLDSSRRSAPASGRIFISAHTGASSAPPQLAQAA